MKEKKINSTVPSVPNSATTVPSVPEFIEECSNFLAPHHKVRFMSIQCYCKPERWGDLLTCAEKFIYILHDKDFKTDGTPQQAHYHIIVKFTNPRFRSAVEKMFNLDGLTEDTTINFQKVGVLSSAVAYLTHNTPQAQKDKKFLYSSSALVSNDLSYFLATAKGVSSATLTNQDFIDDLVDEHMGYRALAEKYGRDYIKNHVAYHSFAELVRKEDFSANRNYQANLDLDYINNLKASNVTCTDALDVLADYICNNHINYDAPQQFSDYNSLNSFLNKLKLTCEKIITFRRNEND